MRLLKRIPGGEFELVSFDDDSLPPYAILSHTWTEGQEVTYHELLAGKGKDKSGYAKIRFCGERSEADGLLYFWVDTCCIDKTTSDELSTAINSMFRWYQRAFKCYAYLSDVSAPEATTIEAVKGAWAEAFGRSRWFTRGWTLQELLAPASVEFFSKEGVRLGSKKSLEQEIHDITKIPITVLRSQNLTEFSVEERMSYAVNRMTTLKEDKVYCLLGICGVFLPLIYGEGEEYATLRLHDEIRRRQEIHASDHLHDMSVSMLPFPRNELFIGREDQLQCLEQSLFLPTAHRRMTVYGLGGCGKSALALEFAYRSLARHPRPSVFWVPAISQESFELGYREIGMRLSIPGIADDNADVKKLVKEALSSESVSEWLLIVDNADDPGVLLGVTNGDSTSTRLSDYLPRSDRGKILFTTRSRKTAGDLTQREVLELRDMGKTEARQLLVRRIANGALLDDEAGIDELLELLTYLPLAIVQAAAFMNNNDIPVSEYIALFRDTGTGTEAELFNELFEDPSRYRDMDSTIAKTWHISFDQIRKQDDLAAEYLSFIACIDRINIPQSLLPPAASVVRQVKALGTLTGYAFITERRQTKEVSREKPQEKMYDMHRLVHLASGWWLDGHGERTSWGSKAAARLEELVPYGGYKKKNTWMAYLSHAIYVTGADSTTEDAKDSLLDRVGWCQASLGQYSAAEATQRQVALMRETTNGPNHLDTLKSKGNVAMLLVSQGKLEEAEFMEKQVLARREEVLGPEHPDTLTSKNNLALVLKRLGKLEEAESMNRQTLLLRQKVLGPEHLDTLMTMSNLAVMLGDRGQFEEAESMTRQALLQREKVLGSENPDTLTSMNNLAALLAAQGKYKEAESMHRQELAICERVLGPEHPDTLTSMNNLGIVLGQQGKDEEAESTNRQALVMREKVLGREHRSTLTSTSNLALVLESRGRYEEAESMNRQVLARWEKALGAEHPDTLTSMNNLTLPLVNQYKYEEAESINRKALAGLEKRLGPEHPSTMTCVSNMALVLDKQGKYEEAELMNRQALARREKVLGPEHPSTLMTANNLAHALWQQNKLVEAESINRATLARYQKVIGPGHPSTLVCASNMALVLNTQGKYEEAELLSRQTLELRETLLGPEHPDTLMSMSNLALVLAGQGHYEEAESMSRQALAGQEKVLGPEHLNTMTSVQHLAYILGEQRCYDESLALYRRACAAFDILVGANHPISLVCHQRYSETIAAQHQGLLTVTAKRLDGGQGTHMS